MKNYLSIFLLVNLAVLSGCSTNPISHVAQKDASEIYADLGYQYMRKDSEEKAILNFKKSLEYRADNYRSLHGLALIMQARKEIEQARKYYVKSLYLSANNSAYLYNYALFLHELKEYKEALQYLELASRDELDENRGKILLLYGLTLTEQREYDRAEEVLLSASNIKDTKFAGKVALFKLYIKNKKLDKATKLLKEIRQIEQNNNATIELARLLEQEKLQNKLNTN